MEKDEATNQTTSDEEQAKQNEFEEKTKAINNDFELLAEKHGLGIVAGVHIKEDDLNAVMQFGNINSLEQAGLAKSIERVFK